MKELISVYKEYKKNNWVNYKKSVKSLPKDKYLDVLNSVIKNKDLLYKNDQFKYTEVILNWLKKHDKNQDYLVKSLSEESQVKAHNINYLKICACFKEVRHVHFLPHTLSKHWPQGLELFTDMVIDTMAPADKHAYLLEVFSSVNASTADFIEHKFKGEIFEILRKEQTQTSFWNKNFGPLCNATDKDMAYLLKWSDKQGFAITLEQEAADYINIKNPLTLNYIMDKFGYDQVKTRLIPRLVQRMEKIKDTDYKEKLKFELEQIDTYMLATRLDKTLGSKDSSKPKKI